VIQPREAGIDEPTIERQRVVRNEYYRSYLCTQAIEIPGVIEALTEIASVVTMAIVTTAKRRDFEPIHDTRSIRSFMAFTLTREDYTHAKPDPEPYLTGVARFNAAKDEVLVVEDSARGMRSAAAAGLDCAVVDNEFAKGNDFSQAAYRIKALHQLLDVVHGRQSG
jgi:HAD superfamily hydrolase (TIGR01509 family)